MVKYAIIQKSKKQNLTGLPSVWKESDWHAAEINGVEYSYIHSFDHYFTPEIQGQMTIFDTREEMDQWIFNSSTTEKTIEI